MARRDETPLDVWLRFDSESDEAPTYEANTYLNRDGSHRIEWYHVDVGQVTTAEFATYADAQNWYQENGYQDYSS